MCVAGTRQAGSRDQSTGTRQARDEKERAREALRAAKRASSLEMGATAARLEAAASVETDATAGVSFSRVVAALPSAS
jgi:hypothetical protein